MGKIWVQASRKLLKLYAKFLVKPTQMEIIELQYGFSKYGGSGCCIQTYAVRQIGEMKEREADLPGKRTYDKVDWKALW